MQTPQSRVAFRNAQYKRITISEVRPDYFYVEGVDGVSSPFRIEFASHPGVTTVPKVGEDWIIGRIDGIWKLMWRFEADDKSHPLRELRPGDTRIEGDRVLLDGQTLWVGTQPYTFRETKYGEVPIGLIDGNNKVFITPGLFLPKSLRVFVNGLRVISFEELSNAGFEFEAAPLEGDTIIVDYDYDPTVFTILSEHNAPEGH